PHTSTTGISPLSLHDALPIFAPHGRVVVLGRTPTEDDAPAVHAARQGVDGFVRSLAKELRAGATGNAVLLAPGAGVADASTLVRSEEHTSELQSRENLVCRLL